MTSLNVAERPITADAVAQAARALFAGEPGFRARLQEWRPQICPIEQVVAQVPLHSRVLDVGCGAGLVLGTLAMLRPLAAGVGIDASAEAIGRAQRMAERIPRLEAMSGRSRPPLEFVVSARIADWPADLFDVVLLVDVLHHVAPSAQRGFLEALLDRVRPGGRFIYKDMASRPLLHATANRLHDLVLARERIHYAAPAMVQALAEAHGCRLIERRHTRRWWYAHDLLVFDKDVAA